MNSFSRLDCERRIALVKCKSACMCVCATHRVSSIQHQASCIELSTLSIRHPAPLYRVLMAIIAYNVFNLMFVRSLFFFHHGFRSVLFCSFVAATSTIALLITAFKGGEGGNEWLRLMPCSIRRTCLKFYLTGSEKNDNVDDDYGDKKKATA